MKSIQPTGVVLHTRWTLAVFLATASLASIAAAQQRRAQSVDVTVLSTMLADTAGIGEWGFSALVVVDGHRILFDTGAGPDTVIRNARALKVDLTDVPDVILSHNHPDHTGGLVALREVVRSKNPTALSRAHVGQGIFLKRETAWMETVRRGYDATGG